jgi:hypothetical protein
MSRRAPFEGLTFAIELRKEIPNMDIDYQGYEIHATVRRLREPKGWEPYVAVLSGGQFKSHTLDQVYTTREEAETAGIAFAKKWIDEGTPNIKP